MGCKAERVLMALLQILRTLPENFRYSGLRPGTLLDLAGNQEKSHAEAQTLSRVRQSQSSNGPTLVQPWGPAASAFSALTCKWQKVGETLQKKLK